MRKQTVFHIVNTIENELLRTVDELTDGMVELCRALVRINTVNPYAGDKPTGLEGAGQALLRPLMEELGGRTRMFEPPSDIYERMGVLGPRGRCWAGRPNLVTVFDLGPGPRIVINSHMDTVGVSGMAYDDPFCATVREGRILGRGTADDKGGMAMGITAIRAVLAFADRLSGAIVHESVVDEECSGSGAGTLACCLEGCRGDEAIVVDGEELVIDRGCQGCLTADVLVSGLAGHAAHGGVNAIDKACLVKRGIDGFKSEREAALPDCRVNLGMFHSGIHPAVVPGSATLSLNIVYAIGEAAASERAGRGWCGVDVRERFEAALRQAESADDWLRQHPSRIEWVKDLLPFETPANAPLVTGLSRAFQDVLGRQALVEVMPAWADGANIARHLGMPTVMFGPSPCGAAHSADEAVCIADLVAGAKTLALYLYRRLARQS